MSACRVGGRHFGHPSARRQLETIGPDIAGVALGLAGQTLYPLMNVEQRFAITTCIKMNLKRVA
jgi:hypothetical protein